MNFKEQEMREDARARIIECLKDGYKGYYCDLHSEVFNTSYYIIGTEQAKKVLEEYGVFDAIGKVQAYEKEYYGRVYTDFSNPEEIANMLFAIIGEEVLHEMVGGVTVWYENWDNRANEETNAKILKEVRR